jgi:hypothetical protein
MIKVMGKKEGRKRTRRDRRRLRKRRGTETKSSQP